MHLDTIYLQMVQMGMLVLEVRVEVVVAEDLLMIPDAMRLEMVEMVVQEVVEVEVLVVEDMEGVLLLVCLS
jgi:hypothetical protein